MKRKISLIGIHIFALALMIGHLLYVFFNDRHVALNLGIASFCGVALFLLDVGFLLAYLIAKKKPSKFELVFLMVNVLVFLAMIVFVVCAFLSYNSMTDSAPRYVCFVLALPFLPLLFITDAVMAIVYWIWKKRKV